MTAPNEELFERSICDWLVEYGGYNAIRNGLLQGEPRDF